MVAYPGQVVGAWTSITTNFSKKFACVCII